MVRDIDGLQPVIVFLTLKSKRIALWSNSEHCTPGEISQADADKNRSELIRKKSILDLFS